MEYKEYIVNFKNVMKNNLNIETYNILEKNINKIANINIKNNNISTNDKYYQSTRGGYIDRTITLYDYFDEGIFYHELFHAASVLYDDNERMFDGFHHKILSKSDIGRGINEGYTEFLTQTYFIGNTDSVYENEMYYANLIERLIGKDKMQSFYFKSDLNGLIDELCKYNNLEDILTFIKNVDSFSILRELRKEKALQYRTKDGELPHLKFLQLEQELEQLVAKIYESLNQFIIESYINKIKDNPNFAQEKENLISLMTKKLKFEVFEYEFDIDSLVNDYCNKHKKL